MTPDWTNALGLEARFEVARGTFVLDVAIRAEPSETVVLVGPNGAGKSTVLRVLAGLERVDRGSVLMGGDTLDGGIGGLFVPAEHRRFGVLPQGLALFPHLTALENVAYGPRSRWPGTRDPREEALDALVRVGLDADIAGRKPGALSGGQAQRVALARALAGAPRALLLDEPLSAVDASTRSALVPELSSWLAAFPGPRILVTHDASDALRFADRIVALEGGRVVQTGTRDELARAPRSRYVADLLGLNVFEGEANGSTVSVGSAALTVAGEADGPVTVTVHPRAVALFRARPEGSPRNALELEVATVEPGASRVRVALTGALDLVAEVTPRAVEDLGLVPGQHVWAAVKATEIRVEPL